MDYELLKQETRLGKPKDAIEARLGIREGVPTGLDKVSNAAMDAQFQRTENYFRNMLKQTKYK